MGFSTIYLKPFQLDRPLTPEQAEELIEFNETEHEDENGEPGGDGKPPTLYCGRTAEGRLAVSEPLDTDGARWQAVPPMSWVTMTPAGTEVEPFALN